MIASQRIKAILDNRDCWTENSALGTSSGSAETGNLDFDHEGDSVVEKRRETVFELGKLWREWKCQS